MSNYGPVPLTPEALRARGSKFANRIRTPLDPEPGPFPPPPDILGDEGLAMLDFVQKRLTFTGALSLADWPQIVRYAKNWEDWLKAQEQLSVLSTRMMPVKNYKGEVVGAKDHPLVTLASNLDKLMRAAESVLGLNVMSRARITADASLAALNVRKLIAQREEKPPAISEVDFDNVDQKRAYFLGKRS